MKSHRLSHNTIITGVVLIIAAAALTLDGWAYFQIQNYKPIQATSPISTTDTMADWQTYTNDTYGYTISYPSNKYISPRSIDTNAIKIQNYNPSPDTFLLSEDEYYIEIDASRSDCSDNPEWQPTKFGTRNGFVNDKEHADWREAGGRYITACIPGHQQAIFIMITSGDSTFTLQKKILSTFRFTDDISDWQTYNNDELGLSFMYPSSIGSLNATTTEHRGETIFWPPGGEDVTRYGKTVRVYKANSDIYKSDFMLYSQSKDYRRLADGACDYPSCISTITAEQISQNCDKKPSSLGYYRECLVLNNRQIEIVVYPSETSDYYAVAYVAWDHNDYPTITTLSKIWTEDPQLSPNQAQAKLKDLLASDQSNSARTAYNEFKTILSTFRFADDISDWQTYTNSQLGFSIKHPAGWKIDDTSTPNKVWFNPRETEAVDSIEVSTKTRNEWLSGFYEDEIVEQRNLVVDGYPAVQIDLDAFGLQETGIFKDGQLYTIISNQQIKELNVLSTFRFTDDVSDSQMYTDTSPLCTAKPVSTEIGSEIYPSDTKYQKLTFLGPIFTAYKCSSSRLNAELGNSNGQYTLGSTVWLKTAPSQQLITILKAVGYLCSEKISDAGCKKWRLEKSVNVTDLIKLEPFSEQLEADDCVFCG